MKRFALASLLLCCAATAEAAGLPVTFEIDDPRDGLYEAAAIALRDLHVQERVPVTFAVVPCGIGSRLEPYQCVNNTGFFTVWGDWMRANPDLIDVGQHGNNHNEVLSDLTRAQQLDLLRKGRDVMATWGMPPGSWSQGRPFSMAAPFAASNADTISVLEELAFHTSVKNSGDCNPSSILDVYCESIPVCELNAQGGRVSGPSCVIKPPETLIQQVNARAGDGKVFIVYHAQDILRPDLQTVDPAKVDSLRAVLQAFRDREIAGQYDLMTLDTHYRMLHGVPTPGPGSTPTPPSGPTATPTSPGPAPTPAPGDLNVYRESLSSPWVDGSWSASIDFNSSVRAFTGTRSIRVAEVGWGALSVHHGNWGATQPIDANRYGSVEFMIFPEGTGMAVGVRLENDAGQAFPLVNLGLAVPGAWKRITVPMSQLNPSGRAFDRVDVLNANGTNINYSIDDFRLVGSGIVPTATPPPAATPTRTPTPLPTQPTATATPTGAVPTPTPAGRVSIYSESLAAPWINASWSATVDYNSTVRAFEGSRSIRVAQVGWGALSVHHGAWGSSQSFDPRQFNRVELMVFSETGGFNVSVRLENDAQQAFPEIATGVIPANTWTRISVPMSQLSPSGTAFQRVDVRNFNGTNVNYSVDRFELIR